MTLRMDYLPTNKSHPMRVQKKLKSPVQQKLVN